MKSEIKVPSMGESINEATIGTLLKPSGAHVEADEEILELETDKVNQVLYAPQAGTITFTVKPEDVVKIGQVIGYVDSEQKEQVQEKAQKAPEISTPELPPVTPKAAKQAEPKPAKESSEGVRKTKESFIAEMRAKPEPAQQPAQEEREEVTIPEAPIVAPSVAKPSAGEGERETRRKMTKVRKVIAERLVEAQQTTAMLTTFNEADMTEVIALRDSYKESFAKAHGVRLGFLSFFVKAVVSALQAYPDFNSYIDGDEIVTRNYVDIGIAVGTEKGVFVPVVRNCDKLSFAEIERAIENYAKKAREGKIAVDDLQGGGFTITNGGVYGSLLSTPILNPPQCGILGMHKIEKRPVVINDQVVIRPMMYLALSYDHRIVDGKEAVTFLVHIKEKLEDPARLLINL